MSQVTLKEAFEYVPKRYRRLMQDSPDGETHPSLGWGEKVPLDRPLTQVSDSYVAVVDDDQWYGALIVEKKEKKSKVRFLGYDSTATTGSFAYPNKFIPHDHIDSPGGFPPVEVLSDGDWWPATILAQRSNGFKIHYIGYGSDQDEIVPLKRMRFPFASNVEKLKPAAK